MIILLFLYARLFFLYKKSWDNIRIPTGVNSSDFVSIVVACRNEESNILNLIKDIKFQDFDINRFELIVVNDHSEDDTLKILKEVEKSCTFLKVLCMSGKEYGKKNAIRKGILHSKGKIILCTDADCRIGEKWIQTLSNYFTDVDCIFVSAPVVYKEKFSLFSKYQYLEMLSLVSSSASAISRSKATLCNGSNMAFRKNKYLEVPEEIFNDFETDDVSLLHYFKKNFNNSIFFAKQKKAIVRTSNSPTISSYLSQKLRWISSSKSVKDTDTILVSLLVYFINLLVVVPFFLILYLFVIDTSSDYNELGFVFHLVILSFFLLIYITKFLSDYFFLKSVLRFFEKNDLLIYLFPFTIINSIFTVVIVPLSFIIPVKWKGRKG